MEVVDLKNFTAQFNHLKVENAIFHNLIISLTPKREEGVKLEGEFWSCLKAHTLFQ